MGYIRYYRNRTSLGVGDPFSLKPPKALRKLKVGRLIRPLVGFIPGVGGALNALLPQPSSPAAAAGLPEPWLSILRAYGFPVGDPFGGMVGKGPANFGGPRAGAKTAGFNVGKGIDWAALARGAAGVASQFFPSKQAGSFPMPPGILPGGAVTPGSRGGFGGGGRRRRTNPGNVRALRRAISRVNSFTKLAKQSVRLTKQVRVKARGRKR